MLTSSNNSAVLAQGVQCTSDEFAQTIVDAALLGFTSCTIAYEFVLFTRLPIWYWYPSLIAAFLIAIVLLRRCGLHFRVQKLDSSILSLLGLSLLCALINVFTLRPDADDFSYFHRATYALLDLSSPISVQHTAHDVKLLPALSPVFLTSSLEVIEALIAKILGVHPLFFYQQIGGAVGLSIIPLVNYQIFRYLKFSEVASLMGTATVILIYIYSGDSHQDWGNFTLVRAWQGKCILIMLLVPLAALFTFRFLQSNSMSDYLRLHFVAFSGIGLSGTAFFLIPFVIGSSAFGFLLCQERTAGYLRQFLLLLSNLLAFAIFVVLIKAGGLPEVLNTDVWQLPPDSTGIRPELLMLERTVFLKKTTLVLYFFAATGLLIFHRKNRRILALVIASLCVCVVIVLPPLSSILIKITLPGVYWRLAYATHMPLIIAVFTVLCFVGADRNALFNGKLMLLPAAGIVLTVVLLKMPAINAGNINEPQAFKFASSEMQFVTSIDRLVSAGAVVAMPEELIPMVGLFRPDLRFISTRNLETLHVFVNAGRMSDGRLRISAQQDLNKCGADGQLKAILHQIAELSYLVFPEKCVSKDIPAALSIDGTQWKVTHSGSYQLWQRGSAMSK